MLWTFLLVQKLFVIDVTIYNLGLQEIQKLLFLYLFTELFHKDFFSLIRINCCYFLDLELMLTYKYKLLVLGWCWYMMYRALQVPLSSRCGMVILVGKQ